MSCEYTEKLRCKVSPADAEKENQPGYWWVLGSLRNVADESGSLIVCDGEFQSLGARIITETATIHIICSGTAVIRKPIVPSCCLPGMLLSALIHTTFKPCAWALPWWYVIVEPVSSYAVFNIIPSTHTHTHCQCASWSLCIASMYYGHTLFFIPGEPATRIGSLLCTS